MTISLDGRYGIFSNGNITTNSYYFGNGAYLTGISASGGTVYSNANVAGYMTSGNLALVDVIAGNILPAGPGFSLGSSSTPWQDLWVSSSTIYINSVPISLNSNADLTVNGQPIVTASGSNGVTNVTALDVSGALAASNASIAGNVVTNQYFIGDGGLISNINAANITGLYSNVNVAAYLPTNTVDVGAANVNAVNVNAGNVDATTITNGPGNLVLVGNGISSTTDIFIDPSSDLGTDGNVTILGNLIVSGNTVYNNTINITTNALVLQAANSATSPSLATGGGVSVGPGNAPYATWLYDASANRWDSNLGASFSGAVTATSFTGDGGHLSNINGANITGLVGNTYHANIADFANVAEIANSALFANVANYASYANISNTAIVANVVYNAAQPNITSVGNLLAVSTSGGVTAVGNISGAYLLGNGAFLTGLPQTYSNANVGGFLPTYAGNILASNVTTNTANISTANATTLNATTITTGPGNLIATANIIATSGPTMILDPSNDRSPGTGEVLVLGNLVVSANLVYNNTSTTTTNALVWQAANTATSPVLASGGGLSVGPGNAPYAKWLYSVGSNSWVSNIGAFFAGAVSADSFTGDGGHLANINAANITGNIGNAVHANIADTANVALSAMAVAGSNVIGAVPAAAMANYANFAGTAFSVNAANVVGTVASALVAATVSNPTQGNITAVGNLAAVSTSGSVTAVGNITGSYFIGNGAFLTGLPSGYSNAEAAAYFASGNANADIITTANISGSYILGNGAFLSGLPTQYSNANVAAYLPTNTVDVGAGNINANGNIVASNVVTGNALSTGTSNLYITGNTIATSNTIMVIDPSDDGSPLTGGLVVLGNLSVGGNITYSNVNVSTTDNFVWAAANTANSALAASGAGLSAGPANAPYATWTYNATANSWQSNIAITAKGGANINGALTNATTGTFSGNVVAGNVSAGLFTGNGSQLSAITGANVVGAVALATNANVANYANTANIAAFANLAAYANTAGIAAFANAAGNANYANSAGIAQNANVAVTATHANVADVANTALVAATVSSNAQPNITSVGTLVSLAVSGNTSTTGLAANTAAISNLSLYGNTIGSTTTPMYLDPLNDGSPMTGDVRVLGNLSVTGNVIYANVGATFTDNLVYIAANSAANASAATGGGLWIGGNGYARWTFNAAGNSWVSNLPITATGGLVAGGPITGSNISVSGTVAGNGALLTNITGANVVGAVALANVANTAATVTSNAQPNITSVGNLTALTVNGTTNLGNLSNVHILGGAAGQSIITDGNGNLSFGNAQINSIPAVYFTVAAAGNNQQFSNTILGSYTSASDITVFYNGALLENTFYTLSGDTLTVNTPLNPGDTIDTINFFSSGAVNNVTSAYGNSNVSLWLGAGQIVNTIPAGNVVQSLGNTTNYWANIYAGNVNVASNIAVGSNVTAQYFIGDGSQLTGLPSSYTNANVATYLSSGTVTTNIQTTANIQGAYILGNGSQLTGLPSGYSDADVQTYLDSGNVSGIIVNGVSDLGNVANVIITGGVAGQAIITDGTGNLTFGNVSTPVIPAVYFTAPGVGNNQQFSNTVLGGYTSADQLTVFYNGVLLENTDYTFSGDTLTINVFLTGGDTIAVTRQFGGNVQSVTSSYGNSNVSTWLAAAQIGNTIPAGDGVQSLGNASHRWANVYATGNITGGDLLINGNAVITGNANIQGTLTYNDISSITTDNLVIGLGNSQTGINVTGGGIVVGNTNEASWLYNQPAHSWVSNIAISAAGNIKGSNITAVGNVTGNYFIGNGALLTGVSGYANANVAAYLGSNSNVAITTTGNIKAGNISVTGNIVAANIAGNGANITNINRNNVVGLGNVATANFVGDSSYFLDGYGGWSRPYVNTTVSITRISNYGYGGILILGDNRVFCIKQGAGGNAQYITALGSIGTGVDLFRGVDNCYEIQFPNEVPGTCIDVNTYGNSAYALFSSGNLYTWGRNNVGQLGLGDTTDRAQPVLSATNVTDVYVHSSNAAGDPSYTRLIIRKVTQPGFVISFWACGYNGEYQFGMGNNTNQSSWTQLTWITGDVVNIWNIGSYRGALIVQMANDFSIWVAGYNGTGQLGLGNTTQPTFATSATAAWTGGTSNNIIQSISAGQRYYDGSGTGEYYSISMLLQSGSSSRFVTAGSNNWGNAGNNSTAQLTTPTEPIGLPAGYIVTKALSCGDAPMTQFLQLDNGDLYTWGYNGLGCVGDGTTTDRKTAFKAMTGVEDMVGDVQGWYYNGYFTNAPIIKTAAGCYTWGHNGYGQVGNYTTVGPVKTPSQLPLPKGTVPMLLGTLGQNNEGLARFLVTTENKLYVWGYNAYHGIDTYGGDNVLMPIGFNPTNLIRNGY